MLLFRNGHIKYMDTKYSLVTSHFFILFISHILNCPSPSKSEDKSIISVCPIASMGLLLLLEGRNGWHPFRVTEIQMAYKFNM